MTTQWHRGTRNAMYAPNIHTKNCWTEYFQAVALGLKPFELRNEDDVRYEVGDLLILQEEDKDTGKLTGQVVAAQITYVLRSSIFLAQGYAALGIRLLQ